jgi:hypothetical protein
LDRAAILETSGTESKSQIRLRFRLANWRDKSSGLDFAPLQLVSQNFKIRFLRWLDEFEALRRARDADAIVLSDRDAFLAVERDESGLGVAGKSDFDAGKILDDDGAIAQCVRANRGDDESLNGGMKNRPAGGKRVGGRAGGSGDDQAVGAVTADEITVDVEFEFDHAGERTFVDDGVVEDVLLVDGRAIAKELDQEHDAFADGRTTGQGFFESRIEFVNGETGEKAEAAHVDGENRDTPRGSDTRGGEKRAVTAEDEKEVGLASDLVAGKPVSGSGEGAGGFFIVDDAQAVLGKPFEKRRDDDGEIRAARARDDADSFEERSGRHDYLGFYFRCPLPAWRKYS